MNAPDSIRHHVRQEIHQIKKRITEAQSGIDSLELILTEIKWIQEQEAIDALKD